MADQPNLLVILTDQHNPRIMGCAGDTVVRTPHLDTLARRGVRFQNAYCGSPVCVPSRMTFLTSQHVSDIGVWTNHCRLPSDIPTFAHGLGAAGYETVICGRMHFVGMDQRHGFERRIFGHLTPSYPGAPGIDLSPLPSGTTGQSRVSVENAGAGYSTYQDYDVRVTDAACRFLRDRSPHDRPWCLVVGYVLPHCPFICRKELFEEYYDRVTMPEVPKDHLRTLHPAMKAWREKRGITDLTEEEIRTARAAYYGLVTEVDENVGRIMDALGDSPHQKETAVVYLSDHGEMAGDHGMWWKSNYYEGSVGVPMIWSYPGQFREGVVQSEVVSLLDVGPTLIDQGAGVPLPDVAGRSLKPILVDGTPPEGWKDEVISEHVSSDPPSRMIRSGPWKLAVYHGHRSPQLFNLDEDPDEFHDLGDDPRYRDVRNRLLSRVTGGWEPERIKEIIAERSRRRRVLEAWGRAVQPPEPERWIAPPGVTRFPDMSS